MSISPSKVDDTRLPAASESKRSASRLPDLPHGGTAPDMVVEDFPEERLGAYVVCPDVSRMCVSICVFAVLFLNGPL